MPIHCNANVIFHEMAFTYHAIIQQLRTKEQNILSHMNVIEAEKKRITARSFEL